MGDICYGVVSKKGKSPPCESSQRAARLRRIEIRRCKPSVATPERENGQKRQKLEHTPSSELLSRDCENAVENSIWNGEQIGSGNGKSEAKKISVAKQSSIMHPKFGSASVCGKRRDMEDAVALHPNFWRKGDGLHYFGVYDGHGCSHVATKCKDRLHELVKEELESREGLTDWESAMERSFFRMDREVAVRDADVSSPNCRCKLQPPACNTVGSTAVVSIITPDKIIIANCGDSRAVLCRNGSAVPLSVDHKPNRLDELNRIQAAGGRVIYWDGPRVLGVLAMSRAIGDDYLKPYVICEPEVTIVDRTAGDEFLILASDGLWDVLTNDTACGVVRLCLGHRAAGGEISEKACSDASTLLARVALARQSADNVSVVVINLKKR
ncbi:protein phosphatase 2C 37-like [Cornus florida]|uniref:protein phosphatase 2C 37-like n=1 Tax=Cornus florida TaxID=4283 RepID=UPI002897F4B6|nr:protein phosphatase 2C 37-like [Cornus florida]